ncbi:MAG: alpha/beta hydrolase-fold protein [Steroidobacteraceae bacterium]
MNMRAVMTEGEDAVVLAPAAGVADAAVIWMHGLGADGYDFVPMIPELDLPDSARVRFVFPHAAVRPVTVNAGYEMRAWYDIRELTPEGRDDEAGLQAARARIEGHIASERRAGIESRRIVLAGFSQGGATALHVGLRYAERLGGIIALSCYLPLRSRLVGDLHSANRDTPILMCHGREDEVVLHAFGEQSRDVMLAAGLNLEWRQYSVGHGLCDPEIFDISAWLQFHLGLASK